MFLPEHDYVAFGSMLLQIRLSVCGLLRSCTLLSRLKFTVMFQRHFVPLPSAAKYGDAGCVENYISETVQSTYGLGYNN